MYVERESTAEDPVVHAPITIESAPCRINLPQDMEPPETEVLFEHTRRFHPRVLIEERHEEKAPRTLRPSKSDTTGTATVDPSSKFDVMQYIQNTREARKAFQSMSLHHSTTPEHTSKHKLASQPLFERCPSPPPTLGLRTRSSTLSLRGKRRQYGSNTSIKKSLVGDHKNTSSEMPIHGGSKITAMNSDGIPRQPKSVQSVFVRTLCTMLEDQSIQHLISWSSMNDGFVFSPSSEFAKVLLSHFRHTSIASFVRQLNMYGFHKVRDTIQNDSPESPLWEFKHADGMFRRGGLVALQDTKSRPDKAAPEAVDSDHVKEDGLRDADLEVDQLRSEVPLQKDYALPELGSLIAGWQATLPHNQVERDSGFHEGDMTDVTRSWTREIDDSDAPIPDYDDKVEFTRSSNSSPINNPKLLAMVENAIQRFVLPELNALKEDQRTRKHQSGMRHNEEHTVESGHSALEAIQSAVEHDRTCQNESTPLPHSHGKKESSAPSSSPDRYKEQSEETTNDSSKVDKMSIDDNNGYPFRFDHILRSSFTHDTNMSRESLLSSHEGSECASDTSLKPHCEVDIQNALDSAMNVVKSLMLQKLVGHAFSEATDTNGTSGSSTRGSGGANIHPSLRPSQSTARNNGGKRARGGGRDPDDEGDHDSDEDDDNRPRKKGPSRGNSQRRLKCPFYQRQPEKYTKAACRGEGFAEMGKLKDHLKRVHMHPLRCHRCHLEMSEEELEAHMVMENACATRPAPQDDRIAPQKLWRLDFKKKPFVNAISTEEKWKILYRMLFPTDLEETIPSPYTRNALSPDLARVLSEALEEELNKELAGFMEPIVARVRGRIPAIIERCRTTLATRATHAHEDTYIETPFSESHESHGIASGSGKPRKKKSNSSSHHVNNNPEVLLHPVVTVSEVKRKLPQYSPAPQLTPSGSSEGSEETTVSASASTDNIAHMDNLGNMQCPEPSANITGVGGWNMYDPITESIQPSLDTTMMGFGLPPSCQGVEELNPAMRPYHNDPYLYGGSAFGADDMQDWSNMAAINRKGMDGYPHVAEQLLDEGHPSTQATDWQVTQRDLPSRRGPI